MSDLMNFAVHFWAPTFKWGISIANVADFSKPPEKLSYPQQIGMHLSSYNDIIIAFIKEGYIFQILVKYRVFSSFSLFFLYAIRYHDRYNIMQLLHALD